MQSTKRHHVVKFQNEVRFLFLKRTSWKQRRDNVASEKGLQFLIVISPLFLSICLDMEQFFSVRASVYNKKVQTQSVTKQELPNCQPIQRSTYQIHSLRGRIKSFFTKAYSLVKTNFCLFHVSSYRICKLQS